MAGRKGPTYLPHRDGRRAAKEISKHRTRRHERDADHDLARRYNSGARDAADDE